MQKHILVLLSKVYIASVQAYVGTNRTIGAFFFSHFSNHHQIFLQVLKIVSAWRNTNREVLELENNATIATKKWVGRWIFYDYLFSLEGWTTTKI